MKIHLCIVSAQLPANLIPVLQDRPDYVVFIATRSMQEKADQLVSLLHAHGEYSVERIIRFDDFPDSPYSDIELSAMVIQDQLADDFPDAHWVVNATGGTKPMALAFVEVFRGLANTQIIYTDTAHNQLDTISPPGTPARPLTNVLTIDSYLKANNKTVRRSATKDEEEHVKSRESLTRWLARNVKRNEMQASISTMNQLVFNAGGKKSGVVSPKQILQRPPRDNWKNALKKIAAAGLVDWDETNSTELYFNSEDALTYLSGGWLEEYAWLVCASLHPNELKMNVIFTDDYSNKANLRNEMDVIIQHNNRLLMIECKTGRFGRHEQKDSDILNKLDSISDAAGGTFCSKMLLSARQLDHETSEGRKVFLTQNAESRNIKVCQFKQLEQLADQVKSWMDSPFH